MQKNFLITDYVHPLLVSSLERAGYTVDYNREIKWDEVKKIIARYDGIIINSKTIMNKEMIDAGKQLRYIIRLGSGLEIIDLDYAEAKGIQVINTPEGNCNAVSEHAMGMLLALFNNLIIADRQVKNMEWHREANRGREVAGSIIGIVGFGHTGKALAQKLRTWNVRILAHDKYFPDFGPEYDFVQSVSKEVLQENADIISFHLPLTAETQAYANIDFFKKCKSGVIVINTSRGQVIPTQDLIESLKNGKVGGACLDVFENEKTHTYTASEKTLYKELFSFNNVVVTPHVAGWTHASLRKIAETVLHKMKIPVYD